MISLRTVTFNLPHQQPEDSFKTIEKSLSSWEDISFPVRTKRIALPVQNQTIDWDYLDIVATFCRENNIRWFNVPIDAWQEQNDINSRVVSDILRRYDNAFCNILFAKNGTIKERILDLVISSMKEVASISETGKDNFRFGASANIKPDGPFFPFTYANGDCLSFSIGLEMAEEINRIVNGDWQGDLGILREIILAELTPQIQEVENFALAISAKHGIEYKGIDFSLAPLPEKGSSVISILQAIGIKNINSTGMLFATAFLTDLLKLLAKRFRSVGFSGVMYSLLEDAEYAAMNDREGVSVDKMIALSTMCGCGVDMVPIAKETDPEVLRTILLEVGCVSSRLNKPLGVRVLPVDSDKDGKTRIVDDQDFIINTRLVNAQVNSLPSTGGTYSYFFN